MPLFGKKKDKKMDMPEVVDFSNDTWSYKGNPPDYQIQSDGFTYDVTDADGNDKNAISLGLSGMLVIILNAKSPKIKEDEILPPFGKVIKTRNWHTMTVKEANFLVQTAIKKLTSSATSGDVFDLASYAPLEVKRVLLKTLFTISRMQLPPEFREEAEHRIIDEIVPDIFANPAYELALLTGLIVKPDEKTPQVTSTKIETSPVLEPNSKFSTDTNRYEPEEKMESVSQSNSDTASEPDSAFAELQKIYGRKIDTMPRRETPAQFTGPAIVPEPTSRNDQIQNTPNETPAYNYNASPSNNPIASSEQQINIPQPSSDISIPHPGNPFANREPQNIPQPNNPFAANRNYPYQQQFIPQPPMPNAGMPQPNVPYPQGPYANPNQVNPQMNPNMGGFPQYPQQMRQPNMPMQANWNTQNSPAPQFPPQGWMQNQQNMQNGQNVQMNQQWQAPNQAQNNNGVNSQWQPNQQPNRGPYNPQAPQQNTQNN